MQRLVEVVDVHVGPYAGGAGHRGVGDEVADHVSAAIREVRDLPVPIDSPAEDVATECEGRDRKGLYAKARAGIIKEFTGISDPYEEPTDADVTINTTELTPDEAAQEIILHLESEGFIGDGSTSRVS